MSEIRVGPTHEYCPYCLGSNTDGYDAIQHEPTCPNAPRVPTRDGERAETPPTCEHSFAEHSGRYDLRCVNCGLSSLDNEESDRRMLLVWEAWAKANGNPGASSLFARAAFRIKQARSDLATARASAELFEWIADNEDSMYGLREALDPTHSSPGIVNFWEFVRDVIRVRELRAASPEPIRPAGQLTAHVAQARVSPESRWRPASLTWVEDRDVPPDELWFVSNKRIVAKITGLNAGQENA